MRRPPGPERAGFSPAAGEPGYRGNLRERWRITTFSARCCLMMRRTLLRRGKAVAGRSALLDAAFERATVHRGRLKRLKETNQPGFSYWYECTRVIYSGADSADGSG